MHWAYFMHEPLSEHQRRPGFELVKSRRRTTYDDGGTRITACKDKMNNDLDLVSYWRGVLFALPVKIARRIIQYLREPLSILIKYKRTLNPNNIMMFLLNLRFDKVVVRIHHHPSRNMDSTKTSKCYLELMFFCILSNLMPRILIFTTSKRPSSGIVVTLLFETLENCSFFLQYLSFPEESLSFYCLCREHGFSKRINRNHNSAGNKLVSRIP